MPTPCSEPSDPSISPGLEEHLAECPECRDQWGLHREMVEHLSGGAASHLSPGFNARLMRRLAQERAPLPARSWPWLALGVYAVAAAFVSVVILARLDWSWVLAVPPVARAAGGIGVLATPIVLLVDFSWLRRLAGARIAR